MNEFRYDVDKTNEPYSENWPNVVEAGLNGKCAFIYNIVGGPGAYVNESIYIPASAMTALAKWWLEQTTPVTQ